MQRTGHVVLCGSLFSHCWIPLFNSGGQFVKEVFSLKPEDTRLKSKTLVLCSPVYPLSPFIPKCYALFNVCKILIIICVNCIQI